MPEELRNIRWMRSKPTQGSYAVGAIDAENGIIHDVVMVQEGPAKGHGVHLEAEFIENIQKYDVKNFAKRGLKARFGHPSASGETMGTQLGVFKNFRIRQENGLTQEIADLHLLDAAEESPTHPGMRSWVLKMAAESPEFIMSSIVFSVKGYYQRNTNGNKHNLIINEDWSGSMFTNYKEDYGNVFVEFDEHFYTDLVEAGAATDSLFSTTANPHLFVSKALIWLEEHPELKTFAQQYPDKVFDFIRALGVQPKPTKKLTMPTLKELFFGKEPTTEDVTLSPEQIIELRDKVAAAENLVTSLTAQFDELKIEVHALKSELAQKEIALDAANAKILELEKEPADTHTVGASGAEGEGDIKAFQKDPATQKAMASFNKGKK